MASDLATRRLLIDCLQPLLEKLWESGVRGAQDREQSIKVSIARNGFTSILTSHELMDSNTDMARALLIGLQKEQKLDARYQASTIEKLKNA